MSLAKHNELSERRDQPGVQVSMFEDHCIEAPSAPKLVLVSDNDMGPVSTEEELNLCLNLPDALFHDMEYVFRNHVQKRESLDGSTGEQPTGQLDMLSGSLSMDPCVFENLMWVFDLYETNALISFDLTCYTLNVDPESIRTVTAKLMKPELCECYQFVHGIDATYAQKMAKKISEYVNVL